MIGRCLGLMEKKCDININSIKSQAREKKHSWNSTDPRDGPSGNIRYGRREHLSKKGLVDAQMFVNNGTKDDFNVNLNIQRGKEEKKLLKLD